MEISDTWWLVMVLFPWGKQSVSIFGEIGSHILDRAQGVPGSAGRVRGLHLTPRA